MKINPSQDTAASLLSSAISRDKFQTDFQASLDTAKENLAGNRKQRSVEPEAMLDAMATARRELEEYIEKGPIAHMREKILEQMGLTEEDIAKMSPEQRETVEKTIAAKMKEWLLAGSGIDTKGIQAQLVNTSLPAAAPAAAAKETQSL
jgi:hypothetical protein